MRFRPCIDIHNGKVKQIVGGSLTDDGRNTKENFVSEKDAAFYAGIYKEHALKGGHIAMLNASSAPEYEATREEALKALRVYPGGMQIGGGINADNACEFLDAGASHVIVTSYVFRDGIIDMDRLKKLEAAVGRERIVLDLSCRYRDGVYRIVTDRWSRFTQHELNKEIFDMLSDHCDEFLVHSVDVEGKKSGIDEKVIAILSHLPYTITYAGGVACIDDIKLIKRIGCGRIDVTVGSALDLFGGSLRLSEVIECIQ